MLRSLLKSPKLIACLISALFLTLIYFGAKHWFAPEPSLDVLMRQARSAMLRKNYASAQKDLERMLAKDPDHAEALLAKAELATIRGDNETALSTLARISDRRADIASVARYQEGTLQLQQNRAREAEKLFLKALALRPASLDAERALRDLYIMQLRHDDFRAFLRARRTVRPWQLVDLLDYLVLSYVPRFYASSGAETVAAYVEADPDDLQSYVALADYRLRRGEHDRSIEMCKQVLERDPSNRRAYTLLTDTLINLDRVAEAQEVLDQHSDAADSDATLWHVRGRLALEAGDLPRAASCFQSALDLKPGLSTAMYQLGVVLDRTGQTTRARELMGCGIRLSKLYEASQEVMKLAFTNGDPEGASKNLLEIGKLLLECGLAEDAVYCFELLARAGPEQRQARDFLAQARSSLRDRASANPTVQQLRSPDTPRAKNAAGPASSPDRQNTAALRFQDVTADVGITFQYFTGNTGKKYLFETLGGGVAAFDYDGDGWTDLYFCQGSKYPVNPADTSYRDQLYRNKFGESFEMIGDAAGLNDADYTIGCTAGDYDNDGFADLFITNYGSYHAYRNNGDGTFNDVTEQLGIESPGMNSSCALADLDRDGDLDLYVVHYVTGIAVCPDPSGKIHVCYPAMFPGEQDRLFENGGDGRFQDVTDISGLVAPNGKGLGIVVADLDGDAWPDIYIANDNTPNFLFHNLGGQQSNGELPKLSFKECGLAAGAAVAWDGLPRAGMGIACADFEGNGLLDLYVTNYLGETNTLYLNQGNLMFADSRRPLCLIAGTRPYLGFGAQPIDVDLDGNLDLFVTNGHVDDFRDLDKNVLWKMPPRLYRNFGALQFDDVSEQAGDFFRGQFLGRGAARLDWNRDARPDLVIVHQNEPAALLQNVTQTHAHRIVLQLIGTRSNREAVNCRCWVTTAGRTKMLEIIGGDGYLACNERQQIIGLGEADSIDRLEILWPSGRRDQFETVPSDVTIRIKEGESYTIERK